MELQIDYKVNVEAWNVIFEYMKKYKYYVLTFGTDVGSSYFDNLPTDGKPKLL